MDIYRAQTSECSSHASTWNEMQTKEKKGQLVRWKSLLLFFNQKWFIRVKRAPPTWHSRLQYHWRWQSAHTNCASRFLHPWHSGNSFSCASSFFPDGPPINSLFEYCSSSITKRSLSSASSSYRQWKWNQFNSLVISNSIRIISKDNNKITYQIE